MLSEKFVKTVGKFLCLLGLTALCCWTGHSITPANPYLNAAVHQTVTVASGDSVWSIASRHVSNQEDIRHFIDAVRHINRLDSNGRIYPGQTLRIPVPGSDLQIARK